MDQPIEQRIRKIEERLDKIEQQTEPIKVTRIEGASEDVLNRLESMDKKLDRIDQKQDEHAKGLISHSRNISAFQNQVKNPRINAGACETASAT
jgi:chromosome segregation ATPase